MVVIVLVAGGMYFPWLQFAQAQRFRENAENEGRQMTEEQASTFESSPSGFKVSSPVLGVIILIISLALFYRYLAEVYPISDIM